jgi:hypothetical protein
MHNEIRRYEGWLRSKLWWAGWWAAVDSNHVPPRYQHGALPVELAAHLFVGGMTRTIPLSFGVY